MSIEFIKSYNVKYYIVIILFLFIVVDKYRPFLCTHVNDTNDYINAIMIPVSWVIYYFKMQWLSWSFYGRSDMTVAEYLWHKWPFVVITITCFTHSWHIAGFVSRETRRVLLKEQELLTLPEHLSSPPVLVRFVLLNI
jgi:hypothetical protein